MNEARKTESLETPRLLLRKSRYEDWEALYRNIWSKEESARYMRWHITTSEEDARARMERTLAWEESHPWKYTVEEKASGEAIGWAGVERLDDTTWGETGIALGPAFWRRGYGREILETLTAFCRESFGAEEFVYTAREKNTASRALAERCGFACEGSEQRRDDEGRDYTVLIYRKRLL